MYTNLETLSRITMAIPSHWTRPIKRVLVYKIQQSFTLRICLFYTFSFKMCMPTKKVFNVYAGKKLFNKKG